VLFRSGRDCFLVPGAIDAPTSLGCNAFLRAFPGGARVVCGVPELIEDLGLVADVGFSSSGRDATAPGATTAAALATLGPVERLVADLLAKGPATADDLAARSELAGAAVLSALTLLELRGFVAASYGRYLPAGPLARNPAARLEGASGSGPIRFRGPSRNGQRKR
jgi:DNA processing protein